MYRFNRIQIGNLTLALSLHKNRTKNNARKNLLLPFYGVYFLSFDSKVLNDKQDVYAR